LPTGTEVAAEEIGAFDTGGADPDVGALDGVGAARDGAGDALDGPLDGVGADWEGAGDAPDGVGAAREGAGDPGPAGWGVSANRYPGPSSLAYVDDLSAAAARVAE